MIDVAAGATADGELAAWTFRNVNSGQAAISVPYLVRHLRLNYQPAASPLPQASYRALAPPGRAGVGWGIACGAEKDGRVATAAEVRVGPDGTLQATRLITAYECGAVVNPATVTSQIEGAAVMAMGGALFEAIRFEDGVISNGAFSAYRVPRMADVPPIEVILLDRRDLPSAGAGETPMIAVAPAIANVIFDATGLRRRALPLTDDGLLPA